ncbi:MAG TPA: Hsp70 family protein [Tepidisphaeraceae bacterium]|nr:Hsp70 family protein [Tepidisphaeraceae bacterium]
MGAPDDQPKPRYVIGIDLGTTNSAVAYVDTDEKSWRVRDFPIPQHVSPTDVESRDVLPSFHYEPAPGELPSTPSTPFSRDPKGELKASPKASASASSSTPAPYLVGSFAREHGAAVPGRLVVSAKSWLSHAGVDRTADLLPWRPADGVTKISPVEASRRYLLHMRQAWDAAHPAHPMATQDVVLTVPASFDEVARELTVDAAKSAGIARVTLLEEPQAAFYAWIHKQGPAWESQVREGQKILVCDVGGGTTDFSLIRVRKSAATQRVADAPAHQFAPQSATVTPEHQSASPHTTAPTIDNGQLTTDAGTPALQFIRVAVGEHLILGGDNLDLALAHHVERRLKGPDGKLDPRQWGPLVRTCRALKETLLGDHPPDKLTISVAGGGSKLIGGALQVEVTRAEVEQTLVEGFLPKVAITDKPATRRSGFGEFGLPYAPDPAITKYLAAFLTAHRHAGDTPDPAPSSVLHPPSSSSSTDPARPDLLLFNGGLFESPILRDRLIATIGDWFSADPAHPWRPTLLENDRLDLAVARGAAYYGMVRRGHGVRISGGLARTYYLGVDTQPEKHQPRTSASTIDNGQLTMDSRHAISILPAGTEEGLDVTVPARTFELLIRQPVEFPLYYSSLRTTDPAGAIVGVDPEQMRDLPPIRTVLQSGRKSAADTVRVQLHARLTEIGTLELWLAEVAGDRTWRLAFDVRATQRSDFTAHATGGAETQGVIDQQLVTASIDAIKSTFTKTSPATRNSQLATPPASLVKHLESITELPRADWPSTFMRALWEALLEAEPGRRLSDAHEARWLNLTGFCLRPGYGLAVDDWRVAQTWRIYPQRVAHAKNELVRAEWWILWRRLAGGLTAGQQQTLAQPLLGALRDRIRMPGSGGRNREPAYQFGPHETAEVYRCLGSMELLPPETKRELASMLLDVLAKDRPKEIHEAALFALGRLAARAPVYGPLNAMLPPEDAATYATRLTQLKHTHPTALFAAVQLARKTHDRYRDVPDDTRTAVLNWLTSNNAPAHYVDLVREGGTLAAEEQKTVFGESLPRGLRIE